MDKKRFITSQFRRTHNKQYENYVLTRIWHQIDSLQVKMVTQQYVRRKEGCALLDGYFPQFNIGIEVDEGHHKHENNILLDKIRERDVISATGCNIRRIDATASLEEIHEMCNEVVSLIKEKIAEPNFKPWNIEDEYSPDQYIQAGYISAYDDAVFRKITDCIKCFGIYYSGYQRGTVPHPLRDNVEICFARLFNHGEWINTITHDENIIYEENINPIKNEETIKLWVNSKRYIRYVFAYSMDPLRNKLYRFKGEYTLNKEATLREKKAVWERTAVEVPTINDKLRVGGSYKDKEET